MKNYPHRDDNYTDDIRSYDDVPGSPFYEEKERCEVCGELFTEEDLEKGYCHNCLKEENEDG